jgi:hypothetical protein
MLKIPNTSLCCIACDNRQLSLLALRYSSQLCHFDRILFLTDGDFILKDIDKIGIPAIKSKEEYSLFIIKELNKYIETDFVLLIQYDGFIINPDSWTSEFQQYDYVGAKWLSTDGPNVGNGGFSLRSKYLLQILSNNDFFLDHDALAKGEDYVTCIQYRHILEKKYNVKFATEAVADKFSYECSETVNNTFGFHGLFNMWRYIPSSELENFVSLLSPKTLTSIHALKLGIIYHKREQFREAEIVYRGILRYFPNNTAVLLLLDMISKRVIPDIPV